jgi:hypothetical protein
MRPNGMGILPVHCMHLIVGNSVHGGGQKCVQWTPACSGCTACTATHSMQTHRLCTEFDHSAAPNPRMCVSGVGMESISGGSC